MAKKLLQKLSDISKIHHRAAFTDVLKHTALKPSAFLELARNRYSCRAFEDREVPANMVESILEAARLAPTAMDKQPVHVWVADTGDTMEKLGKATQYLYGAPLVFVVGCKPDEAWVRKYDGKNGAEVDAAIVGTHIMLEASALGLGNVWVGSFDPAKIKADFPETAGYEVVALFPVGQADVQTSANHEKRQSSEEFVSFI